MGVAALLSFYEGFFFFSVRTMGEPTYKDLIQLLDEAERDGEGTKSTAELLTCRFCDLYPHVKIGRPSRFLETVRRINGPIKNGRLKGSSRKSYLKRRWTPRVRNTSAKGSLLLLCIDMNL